MHADYPTLKYAVDPDGRLTEQEWFNFTRLWSKINVPYKEILTSQGSVERKIYFVLEGILRIYHVDFKGRDTTLAFTYSGDFGGVLDSYLLGSKSQYYYESLSAATLLVCNKSDLDTFLDSNTLLASKVEQNYYMTISGLMARIVQLQSQSSEEKFASLMKRSPHIINLIPHKYLANYIGIHPSNFSKFLNTIKID